MSKMGNYFSIEKKLPPPPELFIDLEKGEGFAILNIEIDRQENNLSPPFIIETNIKNEYPKLDNIQV
jgi:hypothetical protein